jgi:regulatory protein
MLISKISEQVKNANRASVFVDGKYSFSLNLDQLLDTKLKVGIEIDEVRLKELVKLSEVGKLKMRSLEWLIIRPRSAKELTDYLRRKKVTSEESAELVTFFQKNNYQNDTNFAKWWADQRRSKQKSSQFIRFELKTKGVSDDIIGEVLQDNTAYDNQSLRDLITKKRRQAKYQDDKKLTEYLLRQGFNYSLIKDVLAE